MILLDTNVVSELMRPAPDANVLAWFDGRPAATLHFSAVGEAELRTGVATLPAGKRRDPHYETNREPVFPLSCQRLGAK